MMNLILTIPLKDNQKIEVYSKTIIANEIEKIKNYYDWNFEIRDWQINSKTFIETTKRDLDKWLKANSDVLWHKGQCKNTTSDTCEGEIKIKYYSRTDLVKIIKNGIDIRKNGYLVPGSYGYFDTYSSSEVGKVYQEANGMLCNSCLKILRDKAYVQDQEIALLRKKMREEERVLNQKKKSELIEYLGQHLPAKPIYYTTGFRELDKILEGGIKKGTLNVFASNPFSKIHSFFLSIINHFVDEVPHCAFISFASTKPEMEALLLANKTEITENNLYEELDQLDFSQLINIKENSKNGSKITLIAPEHRTMDDVEVIIEQEYNKGTRVFFIDSLQSLLVGKSDSRYTTNTEQVFTSNCRRLIDIIRAKEITIIAISLLNRNIYNRDREFKFKNSEVRIPRIDDLRDSNILDHLAHNIVFLHHPATYDSQTHISSAFLVVAKNGIRNNCGNCEITFDPNRNQFFSNFMY